MVDVARRACRDGRLVWWVGLPAQRSSVLRLVTEDGFTALGIEFMSAQQMYYRLLAHALRSCPLVVGSGRLVRVAEALADVGGVLPTPGEARLFAYAIAEAKRYGLSAADVEREAGMVGSDPERQRFAAVFAAYERRLEGAWDYDDVRAEATSLACTADDPCEADVVIVDGLREIGPLELRLVQGLSRSTEVHLTLPAPPPTCEATHVLPPRAGDAVARYLAPNPVTEARWVLRSVKRDLVEERIDPLDVAIIVPPERVRAFATLAEEYGVPVMDETPSALADDAAGRVLVDLLELPDLPTPSRILAIPELARLANAALQHGVAGAEAVAMLAERLDMQETWWAWLRRLEVDGDPVDWATSLVHDVVPACGVSLPDRFEDLVLSKAQEAARLATGPGFRAWWAALLLDARRPRREPGGVPLLTATLASGRRFAKAYVVGAVEGVYGAGEREDYFVPEEDRVAWEDVFVRLGLPRRFQGRSEVLVDELLRRADHVVVTAPEADQGGPLVFDAALLGERPRPLPDVPAGSRLELDDAEPYRASLEPVSLGTPTVEFLRRYEACPFRAWGERALAPRSPSTEDQDAEPMWRALRRALLEHERLSDARLEGMTRAFPDAASWLRDHAERLLRLTYGVRLGGRGDHAQARLDAAERGRLDDGSAAAGADGGDACEAARGGANTSRAGTRVTLYRFVAPDAAKTVEEAEAILDARWTEYWAAGALLEQRSVDVKRVDLVVWPLLGAPIDVVERGITYAWRRIERRREDVRRVLPAFRSGAVQPKPGYVCRDCPVFDVCRQGARR